MDIKVEDELEPTKRPRESEACEHLGLLYLSLQVAFALYFQHHPRPTESKKKANPKGKKVSMAQFIRFSDLSKFWKHVTKEDIRQHVGSTALMLIYDVVPKEFSMEVIEYFEDAGDDNSQRHRVTIGIMVPSTLTFDAVAISKRRQRFDEIMLTERPPVTLPIPLLNLIELLEGTEDGFVLAKDVQEQEENSWKWNPPKEIQSNVDNFVASVQHNPFYMKTITHYSVNEGSDPIYSECESFNHPGVVEALRHFGIDKLYQHQEDALKIIRSGKSVVVTTATASGKSLTYLIPILHMLRTESKGTALYFAPTKALEHDQYRAATKFFGADVRDLVGTYDGDSTSPERRTVMSGQFRFLLTNPDMLHCSVLPNHKHSTWSNFLENLRYVVIDEAHMYRGVFGGHFSFLMRRLRRLCAFHRSSSGGPVPEPIFIILSATLANPAQLGNSLIGKDVEVVDSCTSARPKKHLLFISCPYSVYTYVGNVIADLMSCNLQTLCFVKSRSLCEIVLQSVWNALEQRNAIELKEKIRSYRAGYTVDDRRQIEADLSSTKLIAAVCTNAMEIGVDIGKLDAVITLGYPGSVSSLWQQFGRCGRSVRSSGLGVFISMPDPIDHEICRHADEFIHRKAEDIKVCSTNRCIGGMHATLHHFVELAKDVDTDPSWKDLFGEDIATNDVMNGQFGLRSISDDCVRVVDSSSGTLIEELRGFELYFRVYEGAVLLHQGKTFLVESLDSALGVAHVSPRTGLTYYTKTRDETIARQMIPDLSTINSQIKIGACDIVLRIYGFHRLSKKTSRSIERLDLPLRELSLSTRGCWLTFNESEVSHLSDFLQSIHGIMHVFRSIMPLHFDIDRSIFGGITRWDQQNRLYYFLIHDRVPGGAGLAEIVAPQVQTLFTRVNEIVTDCSCKEGCPSCLYSSDCGCYNENITKKGTLLVLTWLMRGGFFV